MPNDEVKRALELWFFRDLSDEQRYKLGLLCGLPGEAWPASQIQQKTFLRTVISRLSAIPSTVSGETERKRAVAIIHWVFSADGTKSERSMADEAINKINDPTFMPANPAETQAVEVGK